MLKPACASRLKARRKIAGASLIEVAVSIVIASVGLLALAATPRFNRDEKLTFLSMFKEAEARME